MTATKHDNDGRRVDNYGQKINGHNHDNDGHMVHNDSHSNLWVRLSCEFWKKMYVR